MAANSHKKRFDYVGHVQKDGRVLELAGSREDWSMNHVYQWLWERAQEIGGWLLNESITEAGEPDESSCTYNEIEAEAEEIQEAGVVPESVQRLGASEGWTEYKVRHRGASRYVGRKENVG